MSDEPTALEQARKLARTERLAGRQIRWTLGFATSSPRKKHILAWVDDAPKGLRKPELLEWLARKALAEYEEKSS